MRGRWPATTGRQPAAARMTGVAAATLAVAGPSAAGERAATETVYMA